MISYTDKTITAIYNGKTKFIDVDSDLGKEILSLLKKNKEHEIPEVIKAHELIDNVQVKEVGGRLEVDGVLMDVELANKVREFKSKGLPFNNLLALAKRIENIESFTVRNQLYGFLQHNGHPITKDGTFIAYKKVKENYKDIHTGKFDNSIGQTVEMPRREVDDRPDVTCSSGLHVASFPYAQDFGNGRLVLCEVAPEDVVAVPIDYNQMKMRTCKYKVVGETQESIDAVRWEDTDYYEEEETYYSEEILDLFEEDY